MPQGGWNKGKSKLVAWLKANVDHVGEECLIWPFSCNEKGYGQVGYDGRIQKAHRVMCILAHGEPPEPRYNAAHSCHNGHLGCVHPKHLSWKTPSENTQESAVFRRGDPLLRRLTIEQVDAIRASDKTHAELAAEYGIAINTVGKIMRREIWVNPRSTLTREQILRIRELGTSGAEVADIARLVGVQYQTAWKIVRGLTFQAIE